MIKFILGLLFFSGVFSLFVGNVFFHWSNLYMGALILVYFGLQVYFAISNTFLYYKIAKEDIYLTDEEYPTIAFNIVGYRENADYWKRCLESIRDLDYPRSRVSGIYAFVDGNEEDDAYMKDVFETVFLEEADDTCRCFLLTHGGKRHVMYNGFHHIKKHHPHNEYTIVIDSDTILEKDSVLHLVKAIHWNRLNGCGTGSLKIFNRKNMLTKIVHSRYGFAFDIERGAMSYVGCMNCCSGPFSIYKQRLLDDDLLDNFMNQKYCGRTVGPGDDRHLTNLILEKGYRSIQTPYAIAYTESPEIFSRFLQQQLRWMRSFYRETVWQVRAIPKQHIYLIVITTYEVLFPFFILMSMMSQLYERYTFSFAIHRVIYATGILFLRTMMLLCFQRGDMKYIFNICYFPLYFLFLLPIKIYALLSCYQMQWITSDRRKIILYNKLENGMISAFVCCWIGLLGWSLSTFFF